MKINSINGLRYSYSQSSNLDKKENNLVAGNINLFKQNGLDISFKSRQSQINMAKALISKLSQQGATYDVVQSPKGITVVEFKDMIKIFKTTTFLPNNKKKIIEYRPDGTIPNIGYVYEKDKLKKITKFSIEGKKIYTEEFSNIGLRESLIKYDKNVNKPLKKTVFHKDGNTPKMEVFFYKGTKKQYMIETFTETGKKESSQTFSKSGKLVKEVSYDAEGKVIGKGVPLQ